MAEQINNQQSQFQDPAPQAQTSPEKLIPLEDEEALSEAFVFRPSKGYQDD